MAERVGAAYAPQGLRTKIEVRDGATWRHVPGIDSVSHDAGSRSATTITAFEGVSVTLGAKTIEPVTMNVSMYLPQMPIYDVLEKADDDQATLIWRITGKPNKLLAEADAVAAGAVALTATNPASIRGQATFTGTDKPVELFEDGIALRGHVVRTGGANFVVESVDVDADGDISADPGITLARVDRANLATAAGAVFEIWEPGLRLQFGAKIEQLLGFNVGAQADQPWSSNITVRPTAPVGSGDLVLAQDAA